MRKDSPSIRDDFFNDTVSDRASFPEREPAADLEARFQQRGEQQRNWHLRRHTGSEGSGFVEVQSAIELLTLEFERTTEDVRWRRSFSSALFGRVEADRSDDVRLTCHWLRRALRATPPSAA